MKDLRGKLVLITGAAMGMGRIHAQNFASEGSRVILTDVNETELTKVEAELKAKGYEVYAYKLDVSKRDDCFSLAARIEKEIGTVDILVNNAGIFRGGPVLDYPEDAARRVVEVNQLGMLWMMQAFIPGMLKQRSGHVVNMCSVAGKVAVSYMGPYCATKAAAIMLTDSMRLELYGKGIDFTIVDPYFVSTGMFEGGKPMLFTRWQTPEKVSKKMIEGVKKNYGEVCVPRFIIRAVAVTRSMSFPRFMDPVLKMVREDRMMGGWKEDSKRSF